jgi:hypothetical protein
MTEHPRLTIELVRPAVEEIVKDHPERTVTRCKYANVFDGPECLVGAVLFQLGWTYDELREFDKLYDIHESAGIEAIIMEHEMVDAHDDARYYLQTLQEFQDQGLPWLDAYRAAERCRSSSV